jgi:hypothetical protein
MKKLLSLLAGLIVSAGIYAQQWSSVNEPPSISSVNYAARLAAEILDAAGLQANFQVAEAEVPNAMAVVHQGNRYVLYNPDFIEILTRATGNRWAAVSVLAHEIGHHLYPSSSGRLLATELESDQFSGYVLQKMGATLEDAQAAMKVLGTPQATATHPAASDRLSSIAQGWRRAGGTSNTAQTRIEEEEIEEVVYRKPRHSESALPKNIAGVLKFASDTKNRYYLTTNLEVVKYDGRNSQVIARLAKANSYEYPYIIYDDYGYQLYIHREGGIVNRDGKYLGSITVG